MPGTQLAELNTGHSGGLETVPGKPMRERAVSFLLSKAAVTVASPGQVKRPELC